MSDLAFISESSAPETFNVLLYGEAGAGKSTAAATAPGPILWVNAEGPGALAYPRKIAQERGTEIFEVRIPRGVSPRPVLRQVIEHVRKGDAPQVLTVVVDTVAKVRDGLIRDMVQPGAKNSIQQFGEVAKVLEEFVTILRDEPVNLILLCHEEISDVDGERIVQPLIGGALTAKIPGDVDVMAYCGVSRDEESGAPSYLGQLVAGRGRRAKDRSGGLGQVLPLDLTDWLERYRTALAGSASAQVTEAPPILSQEKRAEVVKAFEDAGVDIEMYLTTVGVDSTDDLTEEAVGQLTAELQKHLAAAEVPA